MIDQFQASLRDEDIALQFHAGVAVVAPILVVLHHENFFAKVPDTEAVAVLIERTPLRET